MRSSLCLYRIAQAGGCDALNARTLRGGNIGEASAKARQALAEELTEAFGLTPDAATTIANAVVEPSAVCKSIGEAVDPTVEEISVPRGTLLGMTHPTVAAGTLVGGAARPGGHLNHQRLPDRIAQPSQNLSFPDA
jgi:hypothetical protein